MKDTEKVRKHDTDTGSAQVQIVALTNAIARLSEHVAAYKKDASSYRSVLKKVATRKRFLAYLKKTDTQAYKNVLHVVGLKK